MARLYRPHIPLSVRCTVAERQLLQGFEILNARVFTATKSFGARLKVLLAALACDMGCEVSDLRLDHDPALATRSSGQRKGKSFYIPDANDPEYLRYRPHGAQFDGSHDVKTRIRGDHGQYSDIALIKRERRRQKKIEKPTAKYNSKNNRPKKRWQSRPFPKRAKKR